jgi:Amt family ammonium transporter
MNSMLKLGLAASLIALPQMGLAQEAAAEAVPSFDEIGPYIMTTLLFCMAGFLVFFMAAGFAMLEGGLVRSKNVTMQMTKNIVLYSFATIMYWLVGFNLMYPGDGWMVAGWVGPFFSMTELDPVGVAAADAALDYASIGSDFFFQLVFVAATASIVSGALAERIKLWPFLAFVIVLTGFLYPISGSWQWGGGWLSEALWQAQSFWGRVLGNMARTARLHRCRARTSRLPLWARSSCGWVGSALTVGRSLLWAPWAMSRTCRGSLPIPIWRRRRVL